MHEEGITIQLPFINFYTPFLILLATHGDAAGCAQVLTELRAQFGAHALAKFYVYGSLYSALLAFPSSRDIVLHLIETVRLPTLLIFIEFLLFFFYFLFLFF